MTVAETIRPYALRGLRPIEIHESTGINPDTIRGTLSRLRRSGVAIETYRPGGRREVRVKDKYREILTEEAGLRGISYLDLKRRLLTTIARDRMVDAILDDEPSAPSPDT